MIEKRDLDLLSDLARLVKRYGPESFERLDNLISSGELLRSISLVTNLGLKAKSLPLGQSARKQTTFSIRAELARLRESDLIKHDILIKLIEPASQGKVLRTADLLELAKGMEIHLPKKTSRERILVEVVHRLEKMPASELEEKVQQILVRSNREHSLQGWADIIMKPRS